MQQYKEIIYSKFGLTKLVRAECINMRPTDTAEEILWVEREEDRYGLLALTREGKRVLTISRDDWLLADEVKDDGEITTQTTVGRVVHCKKEPYDIYIGRANKDLPQSKWHNPFPLQNEEQREEVLLRYKEYLMDNPELLNSLHELKGKVLGCWCHPRCCHGDVLVRMANIAPDQMKIIVGGSRSISHEVESNYQQIASDLDRVTEGVADVVIIEGEAEGPDLMGKRWAKERGREYIPMPAEWDRLGHKGAGHIRNANMALIATHAMLYWSGESSGTYSMWKLAGRYKLHRTITIMKV